MRDREQSWLGDIARTFVQLDPKDDRAQEVILKLLGFKSSRGVQVKALQAIAHSTSGSELRLKDETGVLQPLPLTRLVESETESVTPDPLLPSNVEEQVVPAWIGQPALDKPSSSEGLPSLNHEALFAPHWLRSILQLSLSTDTPTGRIDEKRLTDMVARQQSIEAIPYVDSPSLFRGVQVLIDIGEAMEPFVRDQEELADQIRQTVGEDVVKILQFRNCPLRGAGEGPVWTWQGYPTPPPETPVLVLTDLGIGGPRFFPERARLDEWLAFAALLRQRRCPLVAYVPYPETRWPRRLARRMHIIPWDRTTTISHLGKRKGGRGGQ